MKPGFCPEIRRWTAAAPLSVIGGPLYPFTVSAVVAGKRIWCLGPLIEASGDLDQCSSGGGEMRISGESPHPKRQFQIVISPDFVTHLYHLHPLVRWEVAPGAVTATSRFYPTPRHLWEIGFP
jgi:hypothetical protein